MATILLTWELGGALGHLLRLRPLGEALADRGHRVIFALHDLARVPELFSGRQFSFVQAPQVNATARPQPPLGFADVLAGVGFSNEDLLTRLFSAWNRIFDQVQADLVVTDYSPTALLALRGRREAKVNVGLAFYCPPDAFPLPYWIQAGQELPYDYLMLQERNLMAQVNGVLTANGRPPLQRLSQLFHQIDETILATYSELDPYGVRPHLRYWGHWQPGGGIAPQWPAASGQKIYAYLKPFSGLEELLRVLQRIGSPTIVFASGIDPTLQARFAGPSLRFESHPLDVDRVTAQCDLAITHAGHGMICSMLRAGKPLFLVPMYTEQLLNAQAVAKLGAGSWVLPSQLEKAELTLQAMLTTDALSKGAKAFAARYARVKPATQVADILEHLERHLTRAR